MRKLSNLVCGAFVILGAVSSQANEVLMEKHCMECHNEEKAKGKFELSFLGNAPTTDNLDWWLDSLDYVTAEEMPPEDESNLSPQEREQIIAFLETKLNAFDHQSDLSEHAMPRRMNNREFANSVRDALLLDKIPSNQPMSNLIGDTLHHGFDTHADTLGFSLYHLEQYIDAARKVLDATIMTGPMPDSKRYEIPAERIFRQQLSQNTTRPIEKGENGVFDFLDPTLFAYFPDFESAPASGNYRIKIKAMGKDRGIYDANESGYYHGDPIQLSVQFGDHARTFELPDEEVIEIELTEWLAAGTRVQLKHPSDAFALRGNGNFKFQYAITPTHLKKHDLERYDELVKVITDAPWKNTRRGIDSWQNWTHFWMGARPQVFDVVIEGPFYDQWPSKRQVALLGDDPSVENAFEILLPIATRAWRRTVEDGELEEIVDLVKAEAETLSDVDALKEGILAILVSPSFLLLNKEDAGSSVRFASKFSFLLESTIPSLELRSAIAAGKFDSFEAVRDEVAKRIEKGNADAFLREFPYAWLELNDINFMAPDPDFYRFYHRKRVSEDMVAEVLEFFRHAAGENVPVPELITADYSFVNADLAAIYGLEDVPQDSVMRKYTFTDGRRGGFLGMSAFLTATADSLATSPIHRAIYVMENFMGIHPTPPPPDVIITEPDVRQALTIKEVLAAHTSDETCASCHDTIDPWGYAFESFDPTGAWRETYTIPVAYVPSDEEKVAMLEKGEVEISNEKRWKNMTLPIDASARFRSGAGYRDIIEFREQIMTEANRDRFVRCFITKILTYANGTEPEETDFMQIDAILAKSAEHDYRIVETIAAVIDSPLFRGE